VKGWPILTLQDKTGAVLPVNLVDETGTGNVIQFSTAKANRGAHAADAHQRFGHQLLAGLFERVERQHRL
jgi:hypothetical protein